MRFPCGIVFLTLFAVQDCNRSVKDNSNLSNKITNTIIQSEIKPSVVNISQFNHIDAGEFAGGDRFYENQNIRRLNNEDVLKAKKSSDIVIKRKCKIAFRNSLTKLRKDYYDNSIRYVIDILITVNNDGRVQSAKPVEFRSELSGAPPTVVPVINTAEQCIIDIIMKQIYPSFDGLPVNIVLDFNINDYITIKKQDTK